MRKFALLTAAATLALGSVAATTGAEARPYGFHGGGYAHHGYYGGGRRGIGTGAAVGLGIAGLAAGAIAAGAARDAYGYDYGYARPAYGYSYGPGYGYYGNGY